jgi:UDP-N-acetylglucosamine 4,6-dehydratase
MGSRGSVIPFFQNLALEGKPLPITDLRMTRFWISIQDAVEFVLDSFEIMQGGELYVPRIPSMKIVDLASAISPNSDFVEIGIRPGEKLHEVMITEDDSFYTVEFEKYYAILSPELKQLEFYKKNGLPVQHGFKFSSDNNKDWHTLETFRSVLIENNLI